MLIISLDTESIYTEITQRIAGKYGKVFDWEMKSKVMGRSPRDGAAMTVQMLDLPITVEEYLVKAVQLERECFPHCKPMPGQFYHIIFINFIFWCVSLFVIVVFSIFIKDHRLNCRRYFY